MAVECGAMCGLIVTDAVTKEYLQDRNVPDYKPVMGDADAEYEQIYQFDLTNLEPQVACPPKPDNVVGISKLPDTPITLAFIGSCTGGKLTDLAQAASILKDRQVNKDVQMYVVPASQQVRQQAEDLGYFDIFAQAGAQILKSGCGACINSGKGVLGKQETGIYATNRNFTGRTGDPTGKNYLASPRVVSISAINGRISDRLEDN